MAYDEDLANRIRELIAANEGLTEQKMFGGLAFLIGGNMAVGVSGQGGLMVRVDRENTEALLAKPSVRGARPGDEGLAPRRGGGSEDEASARAVGAPRGLLRALAPAEVTVWDEVRRIALELPETSERVSRVYFTTPHFDGYPIVLVRLDQIGPDDLREVIVEAWLVRAPERLVQDYLGSG
jgi:hypothetical protein